MLLPLYPWSSRYLTMRQVSTASCGLVCDWCSVMVVRAVSCCVIDKHYVAEYTLNGWKRERAWGVT
jgi:hypothetical protein